ncbi:MAG: NAD-dependent epimerase/dehydratase family protein [Aliifodinibius sp.]|nr:NAD-dependent epimerase/dehydratase family protein [Fodinibius sp.]
MKTAFITGITGQDGSYLAEFLRKNNYKVVGLDINLSAEALSNLSDVEDQIILIEGDLNNNELIRHIVSTHTPDEIYNFASISFVPSSWESVNNNIDINARAVANLLEAIRLISPRTRLYQASSSEMFGNPSVVPQDITTPFAPRNPYAAAKAFAHWLIDCYRSIYKLYAVSGILYNHESPRRPQHFVSRKITSHVAKIKYGLTDKLPLGNLEAKRDWGYAGDYIKAMWLMLQQDQPEDFLIGTGKLHTVREFCEIAFNHVGLEYQDFVVQDPKYYRQIEHYDLTPDISRAKEKLGWIPEVDFPSLVHKMVDCDLKNLEKSLEG